MYLRISSSDKYQSEARMFCWSTYKVTVGHLFRYNLCKNAFCFGLKTHWNWRHLYQDILWLSIGNNTMNHIVSDYSVVLVPNGEPMCHSVRNSTLTGIMLFYNRNLMFLHRNHFFSRMSHYPQAYISTHMASVWIYNTI